MEGEKIDANLKIGLEMFAYLVLMFFYLIKMKIKAVLHLKVLTGQKFQCTRLGMC